MLRQVVNRVTAEFLMVWGRRLIFNSQKVQRTEIITVNMAAEDAARWLPYIVDKRYIRGHLTENVEWGQRQLTFQKIPK